MAFKTNIFTTVPWNGGLNTSVDPSLIQPNELVTANNIVFSTNASIKKREGIDSDWDSATSTSAKIIKLQDYWSESSGVKTRELIGITNAGQMYSYDSSGTRTTITGSTVPATPDRATTTVFNDRVIMGFEGSGTDNELQYFDTDNATAAKLKDHPLYGGSDPDPPNGWIVQQHLGRVWVNDKDRPDRLHYSETFNDLKWQGIGDSGALDIGVDDGDPDGITAIFPTFKGQLFVAKRTKLYRITGVTPETFQITQISDSIGCISPNSVVVVDTDDIFWVSERGIHSLAATANFGDFDSNFVSGKIQRSFNEEIEFTRLDNTQAAYLPPINSVVFSFATTGSASQDILYLYNIESKAWYTWDGFNPESIALVQDSDKSRLYFGTASERVGKSFTGSTADMNTSGTATPIVLTIKTGLIFPDRNISTYKGFKKIGVFYTPTGSQTFDVNFTVDRHQPQELEFEDAAINGLLGSTFILGQSTLGVTGNTAPYSETIDGYGRAFTLKIIQSVAGEPLELQGFTVEYQPASIRHEVRTTS